MKRKRLVLVVLSSVFLAMPWFAASAAGDSEGGVAADPPAATAEPVAGLTCGTENDSDIAVTLGEDSIVAADAGGVPDCPVEFSNCLDVPGRKCGLRNCVTVDLGIRKCRQPDGSMFSCTPANIQQTTCNCEEAFHMVCCDFDECTFGECGTCSGGSLALFCQ